MDKILFTPKLQSSFPHGASGISVWIPGGQDGVDRTAVPCPPDRGTRNDDGEGGGHAPMLDIPTPECGIVIKGGLTSRSRRIFSRALLGVKKKGRYYFLTVTSSPAEHLEKKHWDRLRKKLKELLPRTVHFHVITSEGHGVIHIILRLGKGENRLEIKPFRAWWRSYHKATQVRIVRINNKIDLARYISDQRHKKKLAGEFAWQDCIVSWGYSAGWLPKGFTPHFGRFWHKSRDADMGKREMFLHDWLMRCYEQPSEITNPPRIKTRRPT